MRTTSRVELCHDAHQIWETIEDPHRDGSGLYARADRILAVAGPVQTRKVESQRAMNWVGRLYEYEQAHWVRGARPRQKTRRITTLPVVERRLGEWARYQRRFTYRLSLYQRIRLDLSPAFDWDPRGWDWERNYQRCRRFISTRRRLPYLNSEDTAEFAFARWLNRQTTRLQQHLLDTIRAAKIQALIRSGDDPND